MKSVLHAICTTGPGGAETICVELAGGLDPGRFRSSTAVIGPGWVYEALRERGLDPSVVRTGHGRVDVGFLWRLTALAHRKRADLLQSHLLAANLYGALAARLLGIPAVATFHGMVDVEPNDRWARVKLRLITSSVSRLVFVSEALRHHFRQTHAVADQRTTVVPNGVDPEQYCPAPHPGLRAELGVPDDAVLVGAVGNIRPAKAYDQLLRVAACLRGNRPEVRFVVAGEPGQPLFDRLLAQRRELRLEDRVVFLGFRKDIAAVLNGVDFYLNTSTSEGFSLTTVQAMACGLAVVATRSGGPEEIVRHGQDGVLVPVGDTATIARAVAELASDVTRRRRLGEAGRKTAVQRFSLRRMVSAYEAIYEEVLAAPRRPLRGGRRAASS